MKKGVSFIIFIIYVLFGLYFLNDKLNFVKIPETFANGGVWIVFIGGILLVIAGLKFLIKKKSY